MKNLLLLPVFCAIASILPAQIQLEHTYGKGFLKRIRMDVSGEKYVLKQVFCHLSLYDAVHTPFAELTLTSGFNGCNDVLFSEHLLDADDDFEVLFNWLDDGPGLDVGASVWNDGFEQEISSSGYMPVISEIAGGQTKLLVGPAVFALPGPVPEHHYGVFNRLERKAFPVDGERYLTYNWKYFDGFHFHNSDHVLLKSVDLPLPDFEHLDEVSQQYFNDDAQYEFFGTRSQSPDNNGNDALAEVVREDGITLFSEPCDYASINKLPGLPDRLLVNGYSAPDVKRQKVYDAPSLTLLHDFPFYTERVSPDGVSDYYVRSTVQKDTLWLYSGNFQPEKTVVPMTGSNWNFGFSRNLFSGSGKLELFFTTKSGPGLSGTKVLCIDEDGALLYAFPGATAARIDRQPGMDDKFFVTYPDSIQVYDFVHQSTGAVDVPAGEGVLAVPNPFSTEFDLILPENSDYTIRLWNTAGQVVCSQRIVGDARATIRVGDTMPPGIYFCSVTGAGFRHTMRLIKYE